MSFEGVVLPNFLIADLYKGILVEDEIKINTKKVAETKEDKHISVSFLGSNNKQVVIVINDNDAAIIGDEKLQLLTNLLTACKLSLADVAIVNVNNKQIVYNQIKTALQPKFLILMGIDAKAFKLPIIFPEYKIQHYDNCPILLTSDLNNLLGTTTEVKVEKSKLWLSLKLLFSIA